MTLLLRSIVVALVALGTAASAQAPPAVTWEPVGLDSFRVEGIVFAPGPAPDGSLDTLYTADNVRGTFDNPPDTRLGYDGPHRLPPGGEWSTDLCVAVEGVGCVPESIARTTRGTLLIGRTVALTTVNRSVDAGRTWERDVMDEYVDCLYVASADFGHDVFACERRGPVWRSPDGAPGTWEAGVLLDPSEPSLYAQALAEALLGPALAGPRLVAAALGGIATSDDGGATWAPSSMWQKFRYDANGGLARHAVPGHPYGGVLYAGVSDYGLGYPAVYASDDGGATWALRSGGPDMTETRFQELTVVADESGGVWVGTITQSGPDFTRGMVLWSGDGARTWAEAASGLPDASVNTLVFGRDGRLYAGTDKGVWRTAAPVPVAEEDEPETPASVGVSVWPNPAGGAVTVGIGLGSPTVVRVSVVDALGREVAVVHEGPASDGQRFGIDTESWPVGAYTVRLETEAGQATAGLTVVR